MGGAANGRQSKIAHSRRRRAVRPSPGTARSAPTIVPEDGSWNEKPRVHYDEINGTYCGSRKPESFAKWRDETPDDFVFAVKGHASPPIGGCGGGRKSVERFNGGVMVLKDKLGPINWQLAPSKKLDAEDLGKVLALTAEEREVT